MGSAPFSVSVRISSTVHHLYFNILTGGSTTVPPVKSYRSCIRRAPVTVRVYNFDPQKAIQRNQIAIFCGLHSTHAGVRRIITTRGRSSVWIYGNCAGCRTRRRIGCHSHLGGRCLVARQIISPDVDHILGAS